MNMVKRLALSTLLFLCLGAVYAQTVPDAINDALADLSARAGVTITLDGLSDWQWTQQTYPDASLGCPQPGQTYAQEPTNGYRFLLTYNGVTYDYRVSTDRTHLILCTTPTGTTTATPAVSPTMPPTLAPVITLVPTAQQVTILDLPADRSPISADNASELVVFENLTVGEAVTAVTWSPDDTTLAAGAPLGTWLYNTAAFSQPPRLLQVPNGTVYDITFGDNLMVTAHSDSTVRLWDIQTGGQRAILRGHSGPVRTVTFTPDGTILATAGDDNTIRLWDPLDGAEIALMEGHEAPVTALAFSPDGTLLASASADSTIRLWDVISATLASVLTAESPIQAVVFDADGTRLVSGSSDGALQLWDIASGEPVALGENESAVLALSFTPDGTLLVSAGAGDAVHFWDITAEEEIATIADYGASAEAQVTALTFSPDGTVLVFVTVENGQSTIRLWGAE
jgi:WD40 repeat protein